MNDSKIKVVYVEPGENAVIREIGTSLPELQEAVGGLIETYYPFDEEVCIVCNDEGKINGMRPCRAVYDAEGTMMDIVFGPFFVCDARGENFGSLSEDQLKRYIEMFFHPEWFVRIGGSIQVLRF